MAHRVASRPLRHACQPSNGPGATGQRRTRPIMAASMAPPAAERRRPRGPLPRRRARAQRVGRARRLPRARPLRRAVVALAAARWSADVAAGRRSCSCTRARRSTCAGSIAAATRGSPRRWGSSGRSGARAPSHRAPLRPRAGLRALELLDADRTPDPRLGLPVGHADALELLSGWQPERGRHRVRGERLLEAGALTGRADLVDRAHGGRALGLEELWVEPEGYFAYHPGRPVNIHNASLLGAWLVDVAGGADAAESASSAPSSGRSTPSAPTARGRTARARNLGWTDSFHSGYVLHLPGPAARRGSPRSARRSQRGAAHYRALLRRGRARTALGGQAVSRGRATRPAPA